MNNAIIETHELEFSYNSGGKTGQILKKLNLSVEKGSFTAVIGPNGSGKSTLAKHFNAILLPCGGSVTVCKIPTSDEKRLYELRKNAGMVFQNPDNQIVATMVEEDVAFGLENTAVPYEEMHRRVDDALRAVGMTEFRRKAPHLLSGGQKQRIAIAGVLAMQPQCIILDEPTAMLDPIGRREVMDTVVRLNRERGITIILITHYMDEVARADRVIVLENGETVMDGEPRKVFDNYAALEKIGLDVPQSAALCVELRKLGMNISGNALNPSECAEMILNYVKGSPND